VNVSERAMSDRAADQRPPGPAERPLRPYSAPIAKRVSRRSFSGIAVAFILLCWTIRYPILSLQQSLRGSPEDWTFLVPRLIVSVGAVMISLAILAIHEALRDRNMRYRVLAALLLALAGAAIHSPMNHYTFFAFQPLPPWVEENFSYWAVMTVDPLFEYIAISAITLALVYARDINEREEQIHELRALAQIAQLRTLRYQLNPHFLFNTLNSITSLISRNRNPEAEQMTESLADFLRQTLSLDPQRQITLAEEIELQQLYLAIERARFPDRLKVRVDIADDLRAALVPSLITQPLIENSIKYAVARSSEPVELEVIARSREGRLELVVRDNGGNAATPPPRGERVGLSNVSERLRLHYGDEARFEAAPRAEGGFANSIRIPLHFAD
jgi:two-component system LytT family sensor kinase